MNAVPTLVVAGAIRDAEGRILATRRVPSPSVDLDHRWEFPGGKVESGESPAQALVRELEEELCLAVRVGDQLDGPMAGDWPIRDQLVLRVFECTAMNRPQLGADHDHLLWVSPDQLPTLGWLPADQPIAELLAARD